MTRSQSSHDGPAAKQYTLTGPDGRPFPSPIPGQYGGNRATRVYGRLDCPAALRALARGGYARNRVFFADEPAAVAAGYRPCAVCLPSRYQAWKVRQNQPPNEPATRSGRTNRTMTAAARPYQLKHADTRAGQITYRQTGGPAAPAALYVRGVIVNARPRRHQLAAFMIFGKWVTPRRPRRGTLRELTERMGTQHLQSGSDLPAFHQRAAAGACGWCRPARFPGKAWPPQTGPAVAEAR